VIRLARRYAELATTTNFSFLRGASHPEELVARAAALGLAGIGIADRNTLAGVVRAHVYARENREALGAFRVVSGTRLAFVDGAPDVIVYPKDRAAYGRLSRLLSAGNLRAPKGECHLRFDDLLASAEGLQAIALPLIRRPEGPSSGASRHLLPQAGEGRPPSPASGRGAGGEGRRLTRLREAVAGRLWIGACPTYGADMRGGLAERAGLARRLGAPLIAVNDVLMHDPERRPLADVVACIREKTTLAAAGLLTQANSERHLKGPDEMARLFAETPDALEETMRFLDGIAFSLDELAYGYPDELRAGYATPQAALEAFAEAGARARYPDGVPDRVRAALDHELMLVAQLGYAPYFLTVHDIVRFARSQDILCQGRGSAANSTVCYCLGITEVDPSRFDLLFERFVSPERGEPPDIDVDFEHERREEVIQYIYQRYGRERAGLASAVATYRTRSAIRETAKVFGLSDDAIVALNNTVWGQSSAPIGEERARAAGLDSSAPTLALMLKLAGELVGFPRHLTQHSGGFVIARDRLDEIAPIMNAAMEDRTIVEWDKDDLDALGILKIDVLALGMLTAMSKSLKLLEAHYGERLTLASIPSEEPQVYAMIQRADTVGVFQIESRAQMSMLPRLRPANFYDLVIEVAIVRPGPIQGDMVHPYLRRRQGIEPVHFPSPDPHHGPPDELRRVLGRTLGVPLFQEQAMRIAIEAAKFTPEEANRLRRSMATFRHVGTINTFFDKMVEGMVARGYDRDFSERCFRQIEGFGTYGFPESHAASFAHLVYVSSWLKCHHPAAFACALLNSQPMGFYAPAQIVRDAREHGVSVRGLDVNASDWDSVLEPGAVLRLGLRQIGGFREDWADQLAASRPFADFAALARAGLPRAAMQALAEADALRSLGLDRRAALWRVRGLRDDAALPLFAALSEPDAAARLPPMPLAEHVVEDYEATGLSLKAHPLRFLRTRLAAKGVQSCAEATQRPDGARVRVAGVVLVRQRPGSAGGVVFATIEDETGIANVVIWPSVIEHHRRALVASTLLLVDGRIQRSPEGVVHVVADTLADRSAELGRLEAPLPTARADELPQPRGRPAPPPLQRSRDFH